MEITTLIHHYKTHGPKWALISKLMRNRNPDTLRKWIHNHQPLDSWETIHPKRGRPKKVTDADISSILNLSIEDCTTHIDEIARSTDFSYSIL